MAELLKNLVAGSWVAGKGPGTALLDSMTDAEVARVSNEGIDLDAAFTLARGSGGSALRALTNSQRAALLGEIVKVLRTLGFYHRRGAIQAEAAVIDARQRRSRSSLTRSPRS